MKQLPEKVREFIDAEFEKLNYECNEGIHWFFDDNKSGTVITVSPDLYPTKELAINDAKCTLLRDIIRNLENPTHQSHSNL